MATDSPAERVVTEIRAAMARRRVSQEVLARALRISQAAVSRRLNGTVDFTVTEIHTIAEVLQVDAAELLTPASARVRSAS